MEEKQAKKELKKTLKESKDEFNECEDDFCDLDSSKICDNCGKCIECDKNYKIIKITGIIK